MQAPIIDLLATAVKTARRFRSAGFFLVTGMAGIADALQIIAFFVLPSWPAFGWRPRYLRTFNTMFDTGPVRSFGRHRDEQGTLLTGTKFMIIPREDRSWLEMKTAAKPAPRNTRTKMEATTKANSHKMPPATTLLMPVAAWLAQLVR
ncbi:hypothetical protein [Mesorhizobium sp. BH1-1-4]|uniref:hypothetical protein n=1 Tax=Mesorhizobium sp. BH1-1-4 TaxID=2876662 RepID=UPI001CD10D25|nr:hypothetical protein [Mesorhizobium sp. BH1-1-4]MBZ9998202.1 hypothetical protein [Mesorhizobium sp. BH1-1-4]